MTACDIMMNVLMTGGGTGGTGGGTGGTGSKTSSTFIANICNNVADFMKALGSCIILIIGIALIIAAVYHAAKAFAARGNANWLIIVACLLFGGFLAFGGWNIIKGGTFGGFGKTTIDNMMSTKPTAIGEVPASSTGDNATAAKARTGMLALANSFILPFGKALAVSVGVILVMISVYQVGKFLFATGRAQISWLKVAAMCILGSCMFTATPTNNNAGWEWVRDIVVGATKDSVENISEGQNQGESGGLTPSQSFTHASGSGTGSGTGGTGGGTGTGS